MNKRHISSNTGSQKDFRSIRGWSCAEPAMPAPPELPCGICSVPFEVLEVSPKCSCDSVGPELKPALTQA